MLLLVMNKVRLELILLFVDNWQKHLSTKLREVGVLRCAVDGTAQIYTLDGILRASLVIAGRAIPTQCIASTHVSKNLFPELCSLQPRIHMILDEYTRPRYR
jgi:hypothetical protein